ncbi:MAG: hypothetical protein AAFO07_31965 [Bacteroidota bacterium]
MNTPTLSKQFLCNLNSEQKALIWDYFRLMTDPDIELEKQVSRISDIWKGVENDEQLIEWLEFIDYFHTNVDDDALPDVGKRAYLGEYLESLVGLPPEGPFLVGLKCPHGGGYILVSKNESNSDEACKRCGNAYSAHTLVEPVSTFS